MKGNKDPFFSIIIPTCNRKAHLKNCLEALSTIEYPKDRFEIIVVDDGNDDRIADFLSPFQNRMHLLIISQKNAGPAAARNKGREHANGQYLVFTDDDCAPASNWLSAIEKRLAQTPDCAIAGKTVNALPGNLLSETSQQINNFLCAYYNNEPTHARLALSNNLAVPVDRFDVVEGFDSDFSLPAGEDRDLCDRWLYHGFQIIYAPEVIINHFHALNFGSFLKQHFCYGQGAYCYYKKRLERKQCAQVLQPIRFYADLLAYPLTQYRLPRSIVFTMLFVLSQISAANGYVCEKIKKAQALRC